MPGEGAADTWRVGASAPWMGSWALLCGLMGAGLLVAAVVTLVHLPDAAGATTATVFGILFLLAARYINGLRRAVIVEFDREGIVYHAGFDPIAAWLAGGKTIRMAWADIGEVRAYPARTRAGPTLQIRVRLDGPAPDVRSISIAYPSTSPERLLEEMRTAAHGARRGQATIWAAEPPR